VIFFFVCFVSYEFLYVYLVIGETLNGEETVRAGGCLFLEGTRTQGADARRGRKARTQGREGVGETPKQ